MKILPVPDQIFPDHQEGVVKCFDDFINCVACEFSVPEFIFKNHLGVFELAIGLLPRTENKYFEDILTIIKLLVDWVHEKKDILDDEFFEKIFTSLDEGSQSFWAMKNSLLANTDDYSFREVVDDRFGSLNKIIEFMIKIEGFLIASKIHFDKNEKFLPAYDLYEVLQHCLCFFSLYSSTRVNEERLISIPINQWRNIAAHKDYCCKDNKISISYGKTNKKEQTISLENLEHVILEVYRLRINIKFSLGIVLVILSWKDKISHDKLRFSIRGGAC